MKIFSYKTIGLLIILLVIAIGGIYYYLLTTKNNDIFSSQKLADKINLVTYSNDRYGFQFKYPAKYNLTSGLVSLGTSTVITLFKSSTEEATINIWAQASSTGSGYYSCGGLESDSCILKDLVAINGVEFHTGTELRKNENSITSNKYFMIMKNGIHYSITLSMRNDKSDSIPYQETFESDFSNILASLEFKKPFSVKLEAMTDDLLKEYMKENINKLSPISSSNGSFEVTSVSVNRIRSQPIILGGVNFQDEENKYNATYVIDINTDSSLTLVEFKINAINNNFI